MNDTDTGETDAGDNGSSGGANDNSGNGGTTGDTGESGAGGESGNADAPGADGEGGLPLDLLTGVAPGDCAERSDIDALYPMREGAWWRHEVVKDNDVGAPEDKLNYVCPEQPMPLEDGMAYPLLSVTIGGSPKVRWQSTRSCANGRGSDIRRHYDEKYDPDWNLVEVLHYCPARRRTLDCDELAGDTRLHETFTEIAVRATDADWSICRTIRIDQDDCVPAGEIPTGCDVTICPGDPDCDPPGDNPAAEIYQDWFLEESEGTVDVPAGTFADFEIHANEDWAGETSYFYWVRGLGKVYELSVPTEEEWLVSYCIPDGPHPSPPPFDENLPDRCPTPE